MKFGHGFLLALAASTLLFGGNLFAQVEISQQDGGVTVKTATDTLRLTVCSPTSIHVVASPDGNAADATPKQPWLIKNCTPAHFTLTMPEKQAAQPGSNSLWNPAVATVDTGSLKVRIALAWGTLEFQDEQGHTLLQEFQDAARRYVPTVVNGEQLYSVKNSSTPQFRRRSTDLASIRTAFSTTAEPRWSWLRPIRT